MSAAYPPPLQPPPTPVLHNSPEPPTDSEEDTSAPAPQFPSVRLASPPLPPVPQWDLRAAMTAVKVGYSATEAITMTRKNEWLTELGVLDKGDWAGGWHKAWFHITPPVCLTFWEGNFRCFDGIFIEANQKGEFSVGNRLSGTMTAASPEKVLEVFKKVCHVVQPALTLTDIVEVVVPQENHILPLTYVLNL